jgi:hypothetical protein
LRFDHGLSRSALDPHSSHEIGELDTGRTRDHHHAIAQGFTTGFIKKRNVCKEKFGRSAVLVRFNSPLLSNPRMENFFERLPFDGVVENYRSKSGPIQVAAGRKNTRTELAEQLLFNFVAINQIVCRLVGVEEFGSGQNFPKTVAKGAFAG